MAQSQHITLSSKQSNLFIYADRDRIIQCLTNLLSNGIKFSESGGTVKVTATAIGTHAQFEVSDHGRGIPEHKRNAIFERFQQVDTSDSRKRGGTGLGLSITRSIVEQHGGKIWLDSQLGVGSTFFFTVPLAQVGAPDLLTYTDSAEVISSERESNAETHPGN